MCVLMIVRRNRQRLVPPRQELPFDIRIGLFQTACIGYPQTFNKPILRGRESSFYTPLACGLCAGIQTICSSCKARPI